MLTQPEVSFSFSIRVKMTRACRCLCTGFVLPAQEVGIGRQRHVGSRQSTHMPVVRLDVP